MPGIQLYLTEADELNVVRAALDEGCWIVPDLNYENAVAQEIRSVEDYLGIRTKERKFFILSDSFVRAEFSMRRISKSGKFVFYISPSQGGPFLEFLGGGVFIDENTRESKIRPGFLEFSRHYWADDLSCRYDSPRELEDMFKRLARVSKEQWNQNKAGHIRVLARQRCEITT